MEQKFNPFNRGGQCALFRNIGKQQLSCVFQPIVTFNLNNDLNV